MRIYLRSAIQPGGINLPVDVSCDGNIRGGLLLKLAEVGRSGVLLFQGGSGFLSCGGNFGLVYENMHSAFELTPKIFSMEAISAAS